MNWREFLASVNLKDFWNMIWNEVALVGLSLRNAAREATDTPLGPLRSLAIVLLAIVRLAALIAVFIVLGVGILVISLIRGGIRAATGSSSGT